MIKKINSPLKSRVFSIILLVSIILIGLNSGLSHQIVKANHSSNKHNYNIHSSSLNEWVCVDTKISSIPFSTARSRILNTLRVDNPSSDWHGLAGNRVFFEVETSQCSDLDTVRLNQMKARVYVRNDVNPVCGCTSCGCLYHFSAVQTHGGATDYSYEVIYIVTSLVNGTAFWYHHTVSHEFGHMLGLADGYCEQNDNSIMHPKYYCSSHTTYEWPTSYDRNSVTNIANSTDILP